MHDLNGCLMNPPDHGCAGMMSSAYFVGRKAIIEWLNQSFSMSLLKIEQLANGAVALQLMDCLFPGSVPMTKVRWNARAAPEMTGNYKLLQQAFE
jgi:RP/EB family microtubule-associated protein